MPTPPPIPDSAGKPKRSGLNTGCLIALILAGAGALLLILVGSVAYPAYRQVISKAKVVHTQSLLAQTRMAAISFAVEYKKFPDSVPTAPAPLEGPLLEALLGTGPANPRGISFLTLSPAQEGRAGLSAGPPPTLLDSWGTPIQIHLDTAFANSLPDPEHPGSTIPETALLWSAGPDRDVSTWADNVKSWGP